MLPSAALAVTVGNQVTDKDVQCQTAIPLNLLPICSTNHLVNVFYHPEIQFDLPNITLAALAQNLVHSSSNYLSRHMSVVEKETIIYTNSRLVLVELQSSAVLDFVLRVW